MKTEYWPLDVANSRDDFLHVKYLQDFNKVRHIDRNDLKFKFARFFVKFLADLSSVDLFGPSKLLNGKQQQPKGPRVGLAKDSSRASCLVPGLKLIELSQWHRKNRKLWLSNFILISYFLCNFHLLIYLYYQYSYDFDKLRLSKLRSLESGQYLSASEFKLVEVELVQQIERTETILKLVGSPHRHVSIVIECLVLYLILFAFIVYFLGILYYRLVTPFGHHFVRELLDYDYEESHSKRQIESEVMCFMESNHNYSRILSEDSYEARIDSFCWHPDAPVWQPRRAFASMHSLRAGRTNSMKTPQELAKLLSGNNNNNKLGPTSHSDQQILHILSHLLANGCLRPFNKSLAWVNLRTKITCACHLSLTIYMILFFFPVYKGGFMELDQNITANDIALLFSSFSVISILCSPINLFSTYNFVSCLDQIVLVNKLHELISSLIRVNGRQFRWLLVDSKHHRREKFLAPSALLTRKRRQTYHFNTTQTNSSMNCNYLFVFMQYKIFIAQYYPTIRSFQAMMSFVSSIILLIPTVVKLHIPYLNEFKFPNVKLVALGLSIIILIPANIALVPACHLHARFVNLYRLLSSLAAHIIEIESHPLGVGIYDPHTVSLLIKQLRQTDQFMNSHKTHYLGLSGTYINLVKTHFWWGILMLAIIFDDQVSVRQGHSGQEMLSSLFSDPFGVFSQSYLRDLREAGQSYIQR